MGMQTKKEMNKVMQVDEEAVHIIVQISLKNTTDNKTSKLTFICLAATDRATTQVTEKQRLQESIIVNNTFSSLTKLL